MGRHTHAFACIHAGTQTRTHVHIHTHMHACTLVRTHTHTHTHRSARAHTHTSTHTHTHTSTHTHMQLHTALMYCSECCAIVPKDIGCFTHTHTHTHKLSQRPYTGTRRHTTTHRAPQPVPCLARRNALRTRPQRVQGGGDFATGIFRRGKFRISNVCEISRSIFRPLCEINPARNLATMLDLESFEMRKGLVAAQNKKRTYFGFGVTMQSPGDGFFLPKMGRPV